MTNKEFLQQFGHFIDAPNGIHKLRELVLQFAVQGKLITQDPNDETASELLKRVEKHKARLISENKIKKGKLLPAIDEVAQPFELPERWDWTRLGNVAIVNGGFAFKSSRYTDNGVRVIRISDFDERGFKDDKIVRYTYNEEIEIYRLESSNILMAMTGGTVGKSLLVKSLPEPMVVNQRVATIKILPEIVPEYINNFLRTSLVQRVIQTAKNSTNDNISMGDITGFQVPLPPLAEQHRIVARVDELMALCDQLEAERNARDETHQQLIRAVHHPLTEASEPSTTQPSTTLTAWHRIRNNFTNLYTTLESVQALRQSILQLAVQGKLMEQDPNDEPASQLLKKISVEKAMLIKKGEFKKQKPLPEINDEEVGFNSPDGWAWSRMGDLAQYQKGYAFKSKDYLDCGLMITKIKNLTENHIQNSVYITPERALEFDQYILYEGDIVMTTVGSWFSAPISAVGRSFLINKLFDNSLLNQNAVRIRPWKVLDSMYLFACINSPIFKNYLVQEAQGTANQASITQESIKNFLICVPPMKEQHRIVAKVDKLMALCDQLEIQIKTKSETAMAYAEAIVQQIAAA